MKNMTKRIIAVLVSFIMLLPNMPSYAEENDDITNEMETSKFEIESEIEYDESDLESETEIESTNEIEGLKENSNQAEEAEIKVVSYDIGNTSFNAALSISTDTTYTDSTTTKNFYKFALENDGYINITLGKGYIDGGRYWHVEIYDEFRNYIMGESFSGGNTSIEQSYNVGLPMGTYFLCISSDVSGEYNFSVNYTQSSIWEKELNDSFTSANDISVNTKYYGSLREDWDKDYYVFSLPDDGYINVEFGKEYEDDSKRSWSVYLYNENMVQVLERNFSCQNTKIEKSCNVGLAAGTYYIKITETTSTMTYNFKINYTKSSVWEKEFNDFYNKANVIQPGTKYYGTIQTDHNDDWYTFILSSDGYINLEFGKEYEKSGTGWDVYLYNSSKSQVLKRSYYSGNTLVETSCNIGLPAGQYYLKICRMEDAQWNYWTDVTYNFKINYVQSLVWEKEFNDSFDTANIVSMDTEYKGSIVQYNDYDFYKITIPQKLDIDIKFENDCGRTHEGWEVYIYNSNYEQIASSKTYCSENALHSIISGEIDKGIYYLKVEHAKSNPYYKGSCDATYTFSVNSVRNSVRNFVKRLYTEVLGREADEAGLDAWTNVLKTGKEQGAKVAQGFVDSQEFKKRNVSDKEYIRILYRTFFDREPDPAGQEAWLGVLNSGLSRLHVFKGFAESQEFTEICNQYKIIRGYANLTAPRDQNEGVTKFVVRCYRLCLGRDADESGLNGWCNAILTGKNTAKQAAAGFVFSDEFKKKNLSDTEYVKTLYRVFMDREADGAGLNAWVKVLRSGKSREHVFNGFADSNEFREICVRYGIK